MKCTFLKVKGFDHTAKLHNLFTATMFKAILLKAYLAHNVQLDQHGKAKFILKSKQIPSF